MGDFPANPLEKPGYILGWSDEFDGAKLDLTKWFSFYLPHWSSRHQSAPELIIDYVRAYQPEDGCQ